MSDTERLESETRSLANVPSGGVFMCYRRTDGHAAGRLYDALKKAFGRKALFFDVESLVPGDSYPKSIEASIRASRVVLVVIGDHWVGAENERGRRLEDENDFVRREILAAEKAGKRILPVAVGREMLGENDGRLPEKLRFLGKLHCSPLRTGNDFEPDVVRIISALKKAGVSGGLGRYAVPFAVVVILAVAARAALHWWPGAVPGQASPSAQETRDRSPEPKVRPERFLYDNLTAEDKDRLQGVTENNVRALLAMCEDEKLRNLAKDDKKTPKDLVELCREYTK